MYPLEPFNYVWYKGIITSCIRSGIIEEDARRMKERREMLSYLGLL